MEEYRCSVCKVKVEWEESSRRTDMDGMTVILCNACSSRPELVKEALSGNPNRPQIPS